MDDILPPKKRIPPPPVASTPSLTPSLQLDHLSSVALSPPPTAPNPRSEGKYVWWIIGGIIVFIAVLALAAITWYIFSLKPIAVDDKSRTRIQITPGESPTQIGQVLTSKRLIHNTYAFDIYTRFTHTRSKLQAGTYSLSPSESMEVIVNHLVSGAVDQFNITFLPGATLLENRTALIKAGYSSTEVDSALNKTLNHPLFADKPVGVDLEGYIYGETYNFDSSATVEQVLTKTFDEYYKVIKDNNLINGFKSQGLTLYQGITLASIIQREVSSPTDQKQVAQIFFKRLNIDMPLGSDVTYQYAAKKLSITPSPDLDSPYNTRRYPGLPPGPIAVPGLTALEAVARPASGDYLFFLSGDDDITYYGHTDAEHQSNIHDHCKIKCSLP